MTERSASNEQSRRPGLLGLVSTNLQGLFHRHETVTVAPLADTTPHVDLFDIGQDLQWTPESPVVTQRHEAPRMPFDSLQNEIES